MLLTLDKFGRILLPQAVRGALHLSAGTKLALEERDECIVLKPVRETGAVVQKDGLLVFVGSATGDLEEAVAQHRGKRLRHVAASGASAV